MKERSHALRDARGKFKKAHFHIFSTVVCHFYEPEKQKETIIYLNWIKLGYYWNMMISI